MLGTGTAFSPPQAWSVVSFGKIAMLAADLTGDGRVRPGRRQQRQRLGRGEHDHAFRQLVAW